MGAWGRPLALLLPLVLSACGRSEPTAPTPAPSGPLLAGTIGGRPFQAHTALLTMDGRDSFVLIFDHPVRCADAAMGTRAVGDGILSGEHMVGIWFPFRWPPQAGSTWTKANEVFVDFYTKEPSAARWSSSENTVRVAYATEAVGVLDVSARTPPGTTGPAATVGGSVPFRVCP